MQNWVGSKIEGQQKTLHWNESPLSAQIIFSGKVELKDYSDKKFKEAFKCYLHYSENNVHESKAVLRNLNHRLKK